MNFSRFLTRQRRRLFALINRFGLNRIVHKNDVFLVSHPRAGSTWLSFMLACLLYPKKRKDINLMNLNSYVPDINYLYFGVKLGNIDDILPKPGGRPRVIFVHATYNPVFPKVIYLVRNSVDSLVSYWHLKKLLDPESKKSLKKFIRKQKVWPANWDKHVESWLKLEGDKNFKLIKYEDLSAHPETVIQNLAKFLDIKVSKKDIAEIVSLSRFERMKRLEKKHGVKGLKLTGNSPFIRKGEVDSGKKELGKKDVEYIKKRFEKTMKKLGYL
jgi:hypothetical protein